MKINFTKVVSVVWFWYDDFMEQNEVNQNSIPLTKGRKDKWESLIYHGDEWIVAYACMPSTAQGPMWFSIGHAVELYLKAAHTKIFGDMDEALKKGHALRDLWNECRQVDPKFMKSYEILDRVYESDLFDNSIYRNLSKDDQLHFINNQNLYIVLKHLQDLKYIGLPWKTRPSGQRAMAWFHPDSFWTLFFKEFRAYLNYPPSGHADHIVQILETSRLSPSAAHYLIELYR